MFLHYYYNNTTLHLKVTITLKNNFTKERRIYEHISYTIIYVYEYLYMLCINDHNHI